MPQGQWAQGVGDFLVCLWRRERELIRPCMLTTLLHASIRLKGKCWCSKLPSVSPAYGIR